MGYLLHIVLALVAAALAEEGLAPRTELPLVVLVFCAVPYVLAALVRRAWLSGRFARAGALLSLLHSSPAVLQALALLACGWNATIERLTGSAPSLFGWPRPASLLALAPFVVYELLSIDARARATHTSIEGVVRAWRFQGRMFLSTLAPLVVYVLIAWGVGRAPQLRARIDHVELYGALFALALLALFLVLLPFILARTWDTEPLRPGPLRELLEALAHRARFRCREILLWRTENQMANAAVIGLGPRLRVVMLSDALLGELRADETLAVFAHEIGHALRHHVLVFVAWSVAFFLGVDLLSAAWLVEGGLAAGAVLLAALVAWYAGFGWLSRRFELDADVYSAELLGDIAPMVGALEVVGGPHGRDKRTWRHFSTAERIAFLRRLDLEPEHGTRLRRRLRVLAWSGALLATLALLGEARGIVAVFPVESVRAELALGRYARAAERLTAIEAPPPQLARMVATAVVLAGAGGALDAGELLERGRGELADGDLTRALDLLELAALRGLPEAGRVLPVLAELEGAQDAGAWLTTAAELEREHPDWARALLQATAFRAR